ncbi:MAG TPA: ParB/RepB/Spo0J family partition protein [Gemmatimonadaceae bacterium]|nr:ParB/RepB/Spo0J family partition protein [Gemmatimonadaceae bacterium]
MTATKATQSTAATAEATSTDRSGLQHIPLGQIRPNPFQPRKDFKTEELAELQASMRSSGLLQPITVRPAPHGAEGYELIAGERRLRAASQLGWADIPAVVRDIDDKTILTLALIENLQRTDLNPIEEAEGYQRLIQEFSLTQQEVADVVGKDRSTVANILRLLNLPASVRRFVQEGQLTLGHARALLALGNEQRMVDLAREVVAKGLTVRDVEQRARDASTAPKRVPNERAASTPGAAIARQVGDQLRRHLQTDVTVSSSDGKRGKIEIVFYSPDDLDRVLDLILGKQREQL